MNMIGMFMGRIGLNVEIAGIVQMVTAPIPDGQKFGSILDGTTKSYFALSSTPSNASGVYYNLNQRANSAPMNVLSSAPSPAPTCWLVFTDGSQSTPSSLFPTANMTLIFDRNGNWSAQASAQEYAGLNVVVSGGGGGDVMTAQLFLCQCLMGGISQTIVNEVAAAPAPAPPQSSGNNNDNGGGSN